MEQKKRLSIILLLAVALFLFYLSSRKKEPIKIGFITTLTGQYGIVGEKTRKGLLLALEEFNKKGGVDGRPAELIIRNDEGDPNVADKIIHEVIAQGAVSILGYNLSAISMQLVPVVNEKQLLLFSAGATTATLDGLDDQLIRIHPSNDNTAPLLALMSKSRLNFERMIVIQDLTNNVYAEPYSYRFITRFEQFGGDVVKTISINSNKDFSPEAIAKEVKDSKVDGIFLITSGIDGVKICQSLKAIDADVGVLASGWTIASQKFLKEGKSSVEGVMAINTINSDSNGEAIKKFRQIYREKFQENISSPSLYGYELGQLFFRILSEVKDPALIKKKILDSHVLAGLEDDIFIDRYGDANRAVYMRKIKNGKFITIGRLDPSP